ncbi:MAG: GDP-mannose 4,6-dehydratase [Planctomycetaceae bacterium]
MNTPSALITGVTGQDGSYLAELLLAKGYVVHGLVRRSSNTVRNRLDHLTKDPSIYGERFFLHYADLDDATTIRRLLVKVAPHEVYHLAGQSHVGISFDIPESTCEFTAMGTLRLLEILRDLPQAPKFLHVGSSELFGRPTESPQNEDTPFRPVTPYGVAKAFATRMVQVYRDSHHLFACNAICYNHESPRRGQSFVTRKITSGVAAIKAGKGDHLSLGSLEGRRDWGYAPEYVEAMWMMMQHPTADDFVLATGQDHSIAEFLDAAFGSVGLDWKPYVRTDARFVRPAEVQRLVGDASKAQRLLGWKPKTTFKELVNIMVQHDLELAGATL